LKAVRGVFGTDGEVSSAWEEHEKSLKLLWHGSSSSCEYFQPRPLVLHVMDAVRKAQVLEDCFTRLFHNASPWQANVFERGTHTK
jgi:hypothetical protein